IAYLAGVGGGDHACIRLPKYGSHGPHPGGVDHRAYALVVRQTYSIAFLVHARYRQDLAVQACLARGVRAAMALHRVGIKLGAPQLPFFGDQLGTFHLMWNRIARENIGMQTVEASEIAL